ncbi:hypothetical protein, partial [Oscillibacter sp. UBA6647]|uniref:hypothetical protein n=1 Tax=Oscillibacter sp. UBA6647 TaxID=1947021 RepID=UPI0025FB02EE
RATARINMFGMGRSSSYGFALRAAAAWGRRRENLSYHIDRHFSMKRRKQTYFTEILSML